MLALSGRFCSRGSTPSSYGQKITFPANQKVRWPVRLPASLENWGPLAVDVIAPKLGLEIFVFGLPKFGVLVTANAFTLNWKPTRSVIRKFRGGPCQNQRSQVREGCCDRQYHSALGPPGLGRTNSPRNTGKLDP